MSERLLRPAEAASRLGITASALARYVTAGELRAVVLPGGHRRYVERDLRQLLARRGGQA